MKLGILGGTFDPVHQGHLDVAAAARTALGLDRVVLMPCNVPSHKTAPHAAAPHRFAMAALAVQDSPYLLLSDAEMEGDAPAYTIDTLDHMAAHGVDTGGVFFLTGADAFAEIRTWKGFPTVLDRCHFVAVSRPDRPAGSLPVLLPELADRMQTAPFAVPDQPSIFLVNAATAPVSATAVRKRVAAGESISGLVPPPVAAYIFKQGLYVGGSMKGHA